MARATARPSTDFELYRAPGHLIRRAQQLHTAVFAETVTDPDLTSPQFAVLSALFHSPDIDQVSLSQRLAIDRSTIADVLSRLEERQLVRRQRDTRDARRNVLRLTPAGVTVYRTSLPEVEEVGRKLLGPLDEPLRTALLEGLSAMIAANDRWFAEADGHYPES